MDNHKPNPIHILQHSKTLKEFVKKYSSDKIEMIFYELGIEISEEFHINFRDFKTIPEIGDDSIEIGDEEIYIVETNDDRFYVEYQPKKSEEDWDNMLDHENLVIEELRAGVPMEFIVPQIHEPNYLGSYVDHCEEALKLAMTWLHIPVDQIPKEYNPPIPSRPR